MTKEQLENYIDGQVDIISAQSVAINSAERLCDIHKDSHQKKLYELQLSTLAKDKSLTITQFKNKLYELLQSKK